MTTTASDSSSDGDGRFVQTVWEDILILAGDPRLAGYREASERFYLNYREPVYWFVRRRGHLRVKAQDLTQDFFEWLFEERVLAGVTREGGKFRSFLVTVLKNFLATEWQKGQAIKRGGGVAHIPFDDATEIAYLSGLTDHETPDAAFDRKWARTVCEHALARLRAAQRTPEQRRRFECLQALLPGSQKDHSYEEASRVLGMTVEAVRMAVSRLKRHYGELLRQAVAGPGMTPSDIDEELRYLMTVLSRQ